MDGIELSYEMRKCGTDSILEIHQELFKLGLQYRAICEVKFYVEKPKDRDTLDKLVKLDKETI